MFLKQRNRMERFSKETQKQPQDDDEDLKRIAKKKLEVLGVTDAWATPWNMATASSSAVKYIPANTIGADTKGLNTKIKRVPLGLMPKPPSHWRAKVEENYPTYPGSEPQPITISKPIQVRRMRNFDGYATEGEGPRRNMTPQPMRSDSAPPIDNENEDSGFDTNHHNIYAAEPQQQRYDFSNGARVNIPAVTIHFNARDNFNAPHRQQGVRSGRGVFMTTPYVMHDFNAKPRGWNRPVYC